jgi:hypothetical protein
MHVYQEEMAAQEFSRAALSRRRLRRVELAQICDPAFFVSSQVAPASLLASEYL